MSDMRRLGDITIRPHGPQSWQASVAVLDPKLTKVVGVLGSQTMEPWIGASGATPSDALGALQAAVGAVMLQETLGERTT